MDIHVDDELWNAVEVIDHGIVKNASPVLAPGVDAYVLEFAYVDGTDTEWRHAMTIIPPERASDPAVWESCVLNGKCVVLSQASAL